MKKSILAIAFACMSCLSTYAAAGDYFNYGYSEPVYDTVVAVNDVGKIGNDSAAADQTGAAGGMKASIEINTLFSGGGAGEFAKLDTGRYRYACTVNYGDWQYAPMPKIPIAV